VKLLVDQNLAQRVAQLLRDAGHDAVHVAERGMQSADDDEILRLALHEERIVISEDTDFGALLAHSGAAAPSFVLLRSAEPLTPAAQAALLVNALPQIAYELGEGCIAVLTRFRTRIRPLPITRHT
jgi:predicted nuclease of predicted toxin-antitoxin system